MTIIANDQSLISEMMKKAPVEFEEHDDEKYEKEVEKEVEKTPEKKESKPKKEDSPKVEQ